MDPTPNNCLRFGKHKGIPIGDVPADYLHWILKQADFDNRTLQMVHAELDRRAVAEATPASPLVEPEPQAPKAEPQAPNAESSIDTLRKSKPDPVKDGRLEAAGWQRSSLGHWSRSWSATKTRPSWAMYQISRPMALMVQDHLEAQASKKKERGKRGK
jgi:hypothetical protein